MTNCKGDIQKRKRGKDKAKEKFKKNGKFTTKHLRVKEKLLEKRREEKRVNGSFFLSKYYIDGLL